MRIREVTDDPQPGDVVIMQVQANKWNHAGVLLEGNMLLHHLYGRLSNRTRMVATGWKEQ
jgi:cell wall-associated NlpC family hydrolase